jgi:hypothetical protein
MTLGAPSNQITCEKSEMLVLPREEPRDVILRTNRSELRGWRDEAGAVANRMNPNTHTHHSES